MVKNQTYISLSLLLFQKNIYSFENILFQKGCGPLDGCHVGPPKAPIGFFFLVVTMATYDQIKPSIIIKESKVMGEIKKYGEKIFETRP